MINSSNNFSITSGTVSTTGTIVSSTTPHLPYLGSIGTYLSTGEYIGGTFPNSTIINTNNMKTQQVNVAVFTITRDVDTNEIISTKFVKELWVEQKNEASIDLIVAKQLDADFDPETIVIKYLHSLSF